MFNKKDGVEGWIEKGLLLKVKVKELKVYR